MEIIHKIFLYASRALSCVLLGTSLVALVSLFQVSPALAIDLPHDGQPLVLKVKPRAQKVVVSIEPYALLLKSFKRKDDEVSVLLEKGFGAHSFSLKPSHLKLLAEADLFVWGGPDLEPFLIPSAKKAKKQLVLADVEGLKLINTNGSAHSHHKHNIDPHIWLSEQNSFLMAKAMGKALYYLDKEMIATDVSFRMHQAVSKAAAKKNMQSRSLFVYHDAFSYLEQDLQVNKTFVLNDAHDAKAGLKQWREFQNLLKSHKQAQKEICFVTPVNFDQSQDAKKIKALITQAGLDQKTTWLKLDVLAQDQNYLNYLAFLKTLQKKLKACVQ